MLAIHVITFNFISPLLMKIVPENLVKIIAGIIALVAMAPFLRVMLLNKGNVDLFQKLWTQNYFNKGGLICVVIFQAGVALFFICTVLAKMFNMSQRVEILVGIAVFVLIGLSRHLLRGYNRIERRFVDNLNIRENGINNATFHYNKTSQKINRNLHLAQVKIPVNSSYIGKSLLETEIKQSFGLIVVKIIRGAMEIDLPETTEIVYPQDILMVLGNDEQIAKLETLLNSESDVQENTTRTEMTLESFIVEEHSKLSGLSIQDSGMKDINCMIVGIERHGKSMLNPHYTMIFESGDLVWVVGDKHKLHEFLKIVI